MAPLTPDCIDPVMVSRMRASILLLGAMLGCRRLAVQPAQPVLLAELTSSTGWVCKT